jgi:hypothetical protein
MEWILLLSRVGNVPIVAIGISLPAVTILVGRVTARGATLGWTDGTLTELVQLGLGLKNHLLEQKANWHSWAMTGE